MRIEAFGHACLRASNRHGALLMDPWFSREGAFFRSWFQYPENAPLRDRAFEDVDAVLISHNHADHYDPGTLRHALRRRPGTVIHVARFATSWFRRRIESDLGDLGVRVEEHAPFARFAPVPGIEAFFVPEESPGQIDAAIVLAGDGRSLVNLNDARLSTPQLARIRALLGGVDVLALQASGASEYPVNYLYPDADMLARRLEKRALKFRACETIHDALEPERVLFFAGPPIFLDPALEDLDDGGASSVFPHQLDVVRHFETARADIAKRTLFALPGDVLDDAILWDRARHDPDRLAPFLDRRGYARAYRARRAELDFDVWNEAAPPAEDALLDHLRGVLGLSDWVNASIGGAITFVVAGRGEERRVTIDFAAAEVRPGPAPDPLYVLTAPASSVREVIADRATWDDVFLSMRMTFDERTDRFVTHFKTLLKYLDAEMLERLERFERDVRERASDDAFETACGDRRYLVQRRCPHAGVDLERHGEVHDDGSIVCTAHRFRFDLETGACLNARGFALKTRRLDGPDPT